MTTQSSVDKTLEIVKDADKFKARIAELAKAEASAKASTKKAQTRNTELNAEHDKMVADVNSKLALAQSRSKAADKAADIAMQPVIEAQATADRLNKTLKGHEDRVKSLESALGVDVEVLRERKLEFAKKIKNFHNAIKAACDGI
tara:strand:+ start:596 stop:1030 length:435 start_codon:yes stop_codon:yes gene_type:complete